MNITFIEEHQSELTGNSRYVPGDQATFDTGEALIELGIARAGWAEVEAVDEPEPVEPDYESMTTVELIEIARARGIRYAGMRKSELIEALRGLE